MLLLRCVSLRKIAEQCSVSVGALFRHQARHLPVTMAHAKEARETQMGDDLIQQAKSLRGRALGILDKAEKAGELDTALKAVREVRGILELLGKLDGQLQERGADETTIQVVYVDKAVIGAPAQLALPPAADPDPIPPRRIKKHE